MVSTPTRWRWRGCIRPSRASRPDPHAALEPAAAARRHAAGGIPNSRRKARLKAAFCGAVRLAMHGDPEAMGYCHCDSCRRWSAGPVNAFTLWKPASLDVVQGAERIGRFAKTANSLRHWCRDCGGHLFTEHPAWDLVDAYAAVLPDFPFRPALHVNYQETCLRVPDGLPKLADLPAEMGGSGAGLPE